MNVRMKIAFACYLAAAVLLLGFGLLYSLRGEFMPYHADAVGMPWSDVPTHFQVVILGLMKAFGTTAVAFVFALYLMLHVSFRQGARWAVWAIPIAALIQLGGSLYAMNHVAANSPANPPFWAATIGVILIVGAFGLSITAVAPAAADT